jgi:hypothetical protein
VKKGETETDKLRKGRMGKERHRMKDSQFKNRFSFPFPFPRKVTHSKIGLQNKRDNISKTYKG